MTISIERLNILQQTFNATAKASEAMEAAALNDAAAAISELLAVREAQSVPAPIAFSENTDADMCRTWAWEQVKKDVTTDGWTAGDSGNFYGFYCWGWDMRRQYNEQRPPAVPEEPPADLLPKGTSLSACTRRGGVIDGWKACRAAMPNHSGDANEKVPAGFKLVPVEPTPEMCNVQHIGVDVYTGMADDSESYSIGGEDAAKVYRAMINLAPASQQRPVIVTLPPVTNINGSSYFSATAIMQALINSSVTIDGGSTAPTPTKAGE